MRKLVFTFDGVSLEVELFDTPTADVIWAAAPFAGSAQMWGKEVYFSVPISVGRKTEARAVVHAGEIAY